MMSKEDLRQFCRFVLDDLELQNKLKEVFERDEFIEKVVDLGALAGFIFSREDVEQQMRENRKMWNQRWS